MRFLYALFVVLAQAHGVASAQTGDFKRLQLTNEISLEIPSHWTIVSQSTRSNIEAAGRAIAENSGLDGASGRRENLLTVNATPEPVGAVIRVSVTKPPDYSQDDLASLTEADLKEVAAETLKGLEAMQTSGGPQVIAIEPARLELWGGKRILVISYTRKGTVGPSSWRVDQYKIPLPDQLLEITLSYRESDSIMWRPILEKVRRSTRF